MVKLSTPYPKYTREESLSCKLSDRDIVEIRELRGSGLTYKAIGDLYGVTMQCIFHWCLDPEVRKERDKKAREKREYSYNPAVAKKTRERKLKLKPQFKDYEKELSNLVKKTSPNAWKTRIKSREWDKKMGPSYAKWKQQRMIDKYGRAVISEHHRLYMHGIKKTFQEVKDILESNNKHVK